MTRAIVLYARKLDFTPEGNGNEPVRRSEIKYLLDEPLDLEDQRGVQIYTSGVEGHQLFNNASELPGLYELTEQSRSRQVNGKPIREMVVTDAELLGSFELPFSEVTA